MSLTEAFDSEELTKPASKPAKTSVSHFCCIHPSLILLRRMTTLTNQDKSESEPARFVVEVVLMRVYFLIDISRTRNMIKKKTMTTTRMNQTERNQRLY